MPRVSHVHESNKSFSLAARLWPFLRCTTFKIAARRKRKCLISMREHDFDRVVVINTRTRTLATETESFWVSRTFAANTLSVEFIQRYNYTYVIFISASFLWLFLSLLLVFLFSSFCPLGLFVRLFLFFFLFAFYTYSIYILIVIID